MKKKEIKKFLDFFIKGIYAGIMIGVGGTVFLSVSDSVMGSFLFSIGLSLSGSMFLNNYYYHYNN